MAIRILTDSSSDLSKEMIEGYPIDIIPLIVTVDEEEFEDEITITSTEIANAMLDGKSVKTAQVPMHKFQDYFSQVDENDTLICIPISSGLSGTYQTAVQTAEMVKEERPGLDIRVIDAKCISLGLGFVVLSAARKVLEGLSADEIESQIIEEAAYSKHLFTVPELKWLLKGGRISKTSARMGTLLDIKPILHVLDGKLVAFDKVRGKKHRFSRLTDYIMKNTKSLAGQTVGICHVLNDDEAAKMADFLNENLKPDRIIIKDIGAVIASHTGPGLLAIFFSSDEKEVKLP
ncbi:MAG: DegV family protein [Bacillota bacterium]|nr:DegV family protein [Bacillota bacterium]